VVLDGALWGVLPRLQFRLQRLGDLTVGGAGPKGIAAGIELVKEPRPKLAALFRLIGDAFGLWGPGPKMGSASGFGDLAAIHGKDSICGAAHLHLPPFDLPLFFALSGGKPPQGTLSGR